MNRVVRLLTLILVIVASCVAFGNAAGGKRTYSIYDGDQKVVEIAGSGWTTITVGSQVSTYAYGPFGLISRWNQANTKYDQFVFDIFGSPLQQQQQATTNPLGNLIYDSKGELKVSKLASTGGTIPTSVRYDIGALSQWGDGTDNELLALQQDLVVLAIQETDQYYYRVYSGDNTVGSMAYCRATKKSSMGIRGSCATAHQSGNKAATRIRSARHLAGEIKGYTNACVASFARRSRTISSCWIEYLLVTSDPGCD